MNKLIFDIISLNMTFLSQVNIHLFENIIKSQESQQEFMVLCNKFFCGLQKYLEYSSKIEVKKESFDEDEFACVEMGRKILFLLPEIYGDKILKNLKKTAYCDGFQIISSNGQFCNDTKYEAVITYESASKFLNHFSSIPQISIFSGDELIINQQEINLIAAYHPIFRSILIKFLYFMQSPFKFLKKYAELKDHEFQNFYDYENWLCELNFTSALDLNNSSKGLKNKKIISLSDPKKSFGSNVEILWQEIKLQLT